MTWLAQERPDLVARYESLYAHGSNAAPSYQNAFQTKVRPLLDKHGFGRTSRHRADPAPTPQATPPIAQPTLF
jgi:hypothetical protein